ncbi:hypothetical protein YC2023_086222 [Brassica napus]
MIQWNANVDFQEVQETHQRLFFKCSHSEKIWKSLPRPNGHRLYGKMIEGEKFKTPWRTTTVTRMPNNWRRQLERSTIHLVLNTALKMSLKQTVFEISQAKQSIEKFPHHAIKNSHVVSLSLETLNLPLS